MGAGSAEEPSEEIRLARVALVAEICAAMRDAAVAIAFADDVAELIATSSRDSFHDVKKATHRAVEAFVEGLITSPANTTTTGSSQKGEEKNASLLHYAPGVDALKNKHARALCASVLPDARHRHSQVRLSCLRAVSSLVPFLSVAEMEELVAPGVQPMCADRTPGVRLALHEALARWIVSAETSDESGALVAEAPDGSSADAAAVAAAAFPVCALPLAPCLLPMLLAGAADETDANAANAARLVEAAGVANERRLVASLRFADELNENATDSRAAALDAEAAAATAFLPHPFREHIPGPASRRLVASLLPSVLPLAIRETREWTAARRNAGARLLGVALVYAREKAASSPLLPQIVGALVDAVTDDDKDTAERVLVAAGALGAFSEQPEHSWIPLLVDIINPGDAAHSVTPNRRAAALAVAAAAIRAAPPARVAAAACRALADGLAGENTLGGFTNAAVRTQCLNAAANLIAVAERSGALRDDAPGGVESGGDESIDLVAAREGASASLFRVLLQTRAAEDFAESSAAGGAETGRKENFSAEGGSRPTAFSEDSIVSSGACTSASRDAMAALARARGFPRVDDLYLAHARAALESARRQAETEWDGPNPSQRAFCAFFLDAPVSVFAEADIAEAIIAVFASAGARARDPSLRAAMLRAVDAAFEEPLPNEDENENENVVATQNRGGALVGGLDARAAAILETTVFESLVWRAGAAAAAARYAAIVCLGTALRRSTFRKKAPLLVSRRALGSLLAKDLVLAPVFSAMEEDHYAETRKAACYALDGVLATAGLDLGDERRRAVYPEILKRMDDSRDEIRVAAARCARRFFADCVPLDWDETNCLYFLKPFVVHMDDPNQAVRDAALEAALAAAAAKPSVVVEALTPARDTHRFAEHVERALDAAARARQKGQNNA